MTEVVEWSKVFYLIQKKNTTLKKMYMNLEPDNPVHNTYNSITEFD